MYEHYDEKRYRKWKILAVLFVIVTAITAYFSWKHLDAEQSNEQHLVVQEDCFVDRETCVARNAQGQEIRLSMSPKPIPVMKDIQAQVEVAGIEVDPKQPIKVVVSGLNMYMGFQRADLTLREKNNYQGVLVLPVCTVDVMNWQARILVASKDGQVLTAEFLFNTYKK